MRIPFRLLVLCVAVALASAACGPPAALRRMLGRDAGGTAAEAEAQGVPADAFPAPAAPDPPADNRIGALVLTNESSWGLFLPRGRETGGTLVVQVLPGSAAETAGLKAGDVITWLDGTEINNHEQLLTILRRSSDPVHSLRFTRADKSTDQVEVELTPAGEFSILEYLENKLAAGPDPVARYLLAENVPDRNRGIDMIRGLLAEHPGFAEGHALLARLLIDRLNQLTAGGTAGDNSPDLLDATNAIDTAVQLDPESASLLRARSQILLALGEPAKAEIDAEKALEIDESSAETNFLVGTSQLSLDRPAEAISKLHKAVRLDPFVFDYYVNLALCYRLLNRETDTQDTILAARTLAGDDPELNQKLDDIMLPEAATAG
ncbi:MAG TPA: PDZ domain-containing protein [Actinomycetota bacterium]|nr:PDZ domain-containing protein [Actinomycetota bacterium]